MPDTNSFEAIILIFYIFYLLFKIVSMLIILRFIGRIGTRFCWEKRGLKNSLKRFQNSHQRKSYYRYDIPECLFFFLAGFKWVSIISKTRSKQRPVSDYIGSWGHLQSKHQSPLLLDTHRPGLPTTWHSSWIHLFLIQINQREEVVSQSWM